MDITFQALIMGIVQGLTEFLPVSSSGHLVIVPYLLGWTDPFITSLAFSVMLHLGTLVALLVYFWRTGSSSCRPASRPCASGRSRAIRTAAWPGCWSSPRSRPSSPARSSTTGWRPRSGPPRTWPSRWSSAPRSCGWPTRSAAKTVEVEKVSFPLALVIGVAQSIALVPGISRAGITISAGLFAGLTREAAARFSFLMATPIIAGAGLFEARNLVARRGRRRGPGRAAGGGHGRRPRRRPGGDHLMLRYVRTRSYLVFVAERVVIAGLVLVVFLSR